MKDFIFEKGDKIVFAGDSVTDAGRKQPIAEAEHDWLGRGYVRVIESLLGAVYPDVPLRIVNVGTSGNNSRDLLARFERDVTSQNPQWVSILIGINDVWRIFDTPAIPENTVSTHEYKKNLIAMIEAARALDSLKGIILCTPYYMEPNESDLMRAEMDIYSEIVRELAKDYGCILVDFQELLAKYCTVRHSSFLAWDRVHPNQRGATLLAREFLSHCGFDYEHKAY